MNTVKYLNQIKNTEQKIEILRNEILHLETLVTSTSRELKQDIVQSTPVNNQENLLVNLIDYKSNYETLLKEYSSARDKIINQILDLDNPVYSKILYLRFVDGLTLLEVSNKLHYSYRWIITLQGRALKAFKTKHYCSY